MAAGAGHRREPIWEYFNDVPLLMGQSGIQLCMIDLKLVQKSLFY